MLKKEKYSTYLFICFVIHIYIIKNDKRINKHKYKETCQTATKT